VAEKRDFAGAKSNRKKAAAQPKPKTKTNKTKRKRAASKPRGGVFGWLFRALGRLMWWGFSRAAVVGILVLGSAVGYYYLQLPPAGKLMDARENGSVTMLDYKGDVFAWRGDQFGGLVTAETVSPHLRNAVVATEDKRYFRHFGVSPRGILGAIRINLSEGRGPFEGNGGSTITQQVAKRVYFSDLPGLERKLKEVPMSIAMELKYSKNDILTIYLNRAYLGAGTFGFEAASQRYFGKSARTVNPAEAAMLAGLLKAPSTYAPTRDLGRAQDRANLIIGLMEDQGYLTGAEARNARANPARLSETAEKRAGGYFADWIMESAPDFLIKDTTEDVLIRTTFDDRIQRAAEQALAQVFADRVKEGSNAEAAIVVMSADGAVRAMVGGRKTQIAGSFNRATQALRQTGSSFKPFVYAAALESGYRYDTIVEDAPITINVPGSGPYSPKNYSREFLGPITLTEALSKSINTVAVRVSEAIGRERVRAVAQDFGINNKVAAGPALALGASESTLLEMTGAYSGILNLGRASTPYGVTEITLQGDDTPLLGKTGGAGNRVINEFAAQQLVYMMHQVVQTGTGRRANLGSRQAAGKTGTTQGGRDAWFIGFTADYVAGVWMGYDDNSKLSGVTGGGLPAEIWRETMLKVHEGLPEKPLPMSVPAPVNAGNSEMVNLEDAIRKDLKSLERKINDTGKSLENTLRRLFGLAD
jgi:1A family penicillin-binding protein